jgi:hypothetical protein
MAGATRAIVKATERGNYDSIKSNGNGNKEGKGSKSDGNGNKEGNGDSSKSNGNGDNNTRMKAGRGIIMAMKRAGWQQQLGWRATKRAMAMVTKRAMATDEDTMANNHGKKNGGHSMAATMGMARKTWPLLRLQLERGG